jgi:hypothetical protein
MYTKGNRPTKKECLTHDTQNTKNKENTHIWHKIYISHKRCTYDIEDTPYNHHTHEDQHKTKRYPTNKRLKAQKMDSKFIEPNSHIPFLNKIVPCTSSKKL